jgi:glycosyltransferase involved in cell wall biosynthesis
LKVVYFHRKRYEGCFSIEKLFDTVREVLPPEIEPIVAESRFQSRGFFRRAYNIVEAYFRQGDVNHITGDVHFLSYLIRRRKTVLTIHDCRFTQEEKGLKRELLRFFWYVIPVRRVAFVTVISEATRVELGKWVTLPRGKVRVIPDCIPTTFTYSEKIFNAGKPRILQIGTGENKNLVRVARVLEGIPCHLEIVGKLTDEQRRVLAECETEYSNSWDISEMELIWKYQECDMVVFVSTYEGFGLPILEGNAVGRPVITSNISSMPEVAGNAACLVNPFDEKDIRGGVLKVIKDSSYRGDLVQKGLINVERFHPEAIATQYAELYREVFGAQ